MYVPPGQSRVVRLPRPEGDDRADRIVLRGDDHDFDNTFFVVPPRKQEVKLLYAGEGAADDPQNMQYYLRLATTGDPLRQVEVLPLLEDAARTHCGTRAAPCRRHTGCLAWDAIRTESLR